jgi:signal transduction histidine kinase
VRASESFASLFAPAAQPHDTKLLLAPVTPGPWTSRFWLIASGFWWLLVGARILFYALQRYRHPEMVAPIITDLVALLLLWPIVLAAGRFVIKVWSRKGIAAAMGTALITAFAVGLTSRLADGVGAALSPSDIASRTLMRSLVDISNPAFVIPWLINTVEFGVIYLSCLGLTMGVLSYRDLKEERTRHERAEVLATTERLRALRAQLNPHFLFNSLNAVVGLSLTSPEEARTLIEQLGELVRRTLRSSETEWHALADELSYARDFLLLHKLRQRGALLWRIDASAPPDALVPTLVLQPLIENAVVHGRALPGECLEITIWVACCGNDITIEVTNPACVSPVQGTTRGCGVGLRNLRERLAILYGSTAILRGARIDASHWRTTVKFPIRSTPALNG